MKTINAHKLAAAARGRRAALRLRRGLAYFLSGLCVLVACGVEPESASAQFSFRAGRSPAAGSGGGDGPDAPKLTLDEIIKRVERNHPKLAGAGLEKRVAEAKLLEKRGAFDPVVSGGSDFLRYNSSSTPGKPATAFQNSLGVEWATRSGVKFFAGSRYNFGKVKSPLSPTGSAGEYFAGAAVPLMRDFRVNAKTAAETKAALDVDSATADVTTARFELIRAAASNYWEWVAAKQRLVVSERLYEIADARAKQVASRVSGGDLPPIDSTEAATEVQRRMGGVVKAREDFGKAAVKLGLYLWDDSGAPAPLPAESSAPDAIPAPNELPDFVINEGAARAVEWSPEIRRLEIDLQQFGIDRRLAKNDAKPRVDLYLAPGYDTGFDGAGPTFKFGASIELPLRTRGADGRFAQASLKAEKTELSIRLEKQAITARVREAAIAVNAAHSRYLLALQELQLTRDLERGERTRFAAGDGTLFLVNQRERATAETEFKLIEIQTAYEIALVNFRIAALEY